MLFDNQPDLFLDQADIKHYLHVVPILPIFTDFEKIFKAVSPWVDSVMGETLNTRGENWTNLIKTLSFYYPKLLPEFKKWKFQNPEYLYQVGSDFKKAAQRHKIKVSGVYTHGQN